MVSWNSSCTVYGAIGSWTELGRTDGLTDVPVGSLTHYLFLRTLEVFPSLPDAIRLSTTFRFKPLHNLVITSAIH